MFRSVAYLITIYIIIQNHAKVNNLLQTLSKYQVVIIPGNVAVDKKLRFVSYGIDNSELLTCFIFKELKKRQFKIRCHIYKNIDKISKVDVNDYITDQFIDLIYSKDISNFNTSLSKVINQDTIDLIINNNLTLTIGNSFLKGTKII